MWAASSNRVERKAASFPTYTDSIKQLGHGRNIRNEKPFIRRPQRKMQVTDFEGDADRLLPIAGVN